MDAQRKVPATTTAKGGYVVHTEEAVYFFESLYLLPTYIVEGMTDTGKRRASMLDAFPGDPWPNEMIWQVVAPPK
jgi:hypothetical protein